MEHQLKQRQRNDVAFVLGNGKSRLNVDPKNFQERGTVYGCNALYREFAPDYLVAVDVKMVNEIIEEEESNKKKQESEQSKGMPNFDANSMMKNASNMTNNMPKF